MGHFSYTCHLSGIPITGGDKAVLLPIFPKDHWGYDCSQEHLSKFGQGNLCSNDGPNMYFDELCFPIFGEYDSYGRLENVEKDDNTKVLEEFFGLSIDDILSVLCDGRKDEYEKGGQFCDSVKILDKDNKKHMMLLKTSATWYHLDFYNKLAKIKNEDHFDRVELGTHGILDALVFKYIGVDKSKDRYNKLYRKNALDVYSDGTWIHIEKESIYDIKSFKKYCAKFDVEIDDTIGQDGRYGQLYDYILPHSNNIIDFSKNRNLVHMLLGDEYKVHASSFEFYESLISEGYSDINQEFKDKIKSQNEKLINESLTLFYFKKIKEGGNNFLRKNIVDWFNVKQYYYPTGRFLYPVGTSVQDGDHKSVKMLLETALSVTNDILKTQYEDGDYDEEEDED